MTKGGNEMKYIDSEKLISEIERRLIRYDPDYTSAGSELKGLLSFVASLQQEQPEMDLEKVVDFYCINKKVKMTIQELINYYIDTECAETADECGF